MRSAIAPETMVAAVAANTTWKNQSVENCEVATETTTQAAQLLGGWGFLESGTVERLVREAAVGGIVDGANDIHRAIVARSLGGNR